MCQIRRIEFVPSHLYPGGRNAETSSWKMGVVVVVSGFGEGVVCVAAELGDAVVGGRTLGLGQSFRTWSGILDT